MANDSEWRTLRGGRSAAAAAANERRPLRLLDSGQTGRRERATEELDATSAGCFGLSPATFDRPQFPKFQRPREVAHFSLDGRGRFATRGRSMLRRCACPAAGTPVAYDLNAGYDAAAATAAAAAASDVVAQPEVERRLPDSGGGGACAAAPAVAVKQCMDDLLRCIATKEELLAKLPDFVCWRSVLQKIACSPYERHERWRIAARSVAGTLYLCQFPWNAVPYPNRHLVRYWGYKFEQYVTLSGESRRGDGGGDEEAGDEDDVVGGTFYSVVSSRLSDHSLLYGAEVDCYRGGGGGCCRDGSADEGDTSRYVELKTSKIFKHPGQERTFRKYKIVSWWVQSFLLGVSTIVCGFRDAAGVVRHISEFKTSDLAASVRRERDMWSPEVCFGFLDDFLSHVKRTVAASSSSPSGEEFVHVFEFTPGKSAIATRKYSVDECPYKFMPDWYLERLQRVP